MKRIKKKPREGLCCITVPGTFIRRHPLNGVGCRSLPSASRHAVVVSARYRVAGCARILPDACLRLSHLTAFTTTVDCTALMNSGYWTMCTCYTCIMIHQAIAVQSQLCAPFIDRSHAASICASLRGCWIKCGGSDLILILLHPPHYLTNSFRR